MSWTKKRSELAHAVRRGAEEEEVSSLRRDLRALRAEEYVQRIVDEAPPLTAEQVSRLRAILSTAHDEVLDASDLPHSGYGGGLTNDAA